MRRPGAIALVRGANALFCVAASAYCLIAYSPFAYDQFIKPNTVPAITDFVVLSPWLFLVVLLATVLTILPQLRGGRGQREAWSYLVLALLAGVLMFVQRPLEHAGHTPAAFVLGLFALVFPVWLAALDHAVWPAANMRGTDAGRALMTCLLAAASVWASYGAAAPVRLRQTLGIELAPPMLATAAIASLVFHLFVFTALFLAIVTAMRLSVLAGRPGWATYWLLVGCLAACSTFVLSLLVCRSIAFTGWEAWTWSAGFGVTVAAVWTDLARLRTQRAVVAPPAPSSRPGPPVENEPAIDPIEMFSAPVVGVRLSNAALLLVIPFAAYALAEAVRHLDWNFLLQKLGVLAIWMVALACAAAALRRRQRDASPVLVAGVPVLVLGLYHASGMVNARTTIDRYVALDPSFRLIRDAQLGHSSATAEYYRMLRANTLLPARNVHSPDVDFARPLAAAAGRRPHIFLIVVDSLRRDYLSPYDADVTFTPQVARFAADSFVFRRVFTRYSGTGLAVPSIWAGGMVPHTLEQPAFAGRNTLGKLLDANGYRRIMDIDHVVEELMPRTADLEELDRGKKTTELDLCATLDQLEAALQRRNDRPVFFYSLPQNVHIAIATRRPVPPDESYPARFYDRVASSVHRIDGCLGGFVDFLKRQNLYDDSIVVLTADHGDSLGEEGRWGHAYFMYPEVMNIPLIVHVPSWIRAHVRTDLDAVVFSTDLSPTLYALLGYQPGDLGPLFGHPLFAGRDSADTLRREGPFLLASSYGPVYGLVRQNGRRMHVVDAVNGQEYAFDLSASPRAMEVTPATSASNRRAIAEQVAALASVFRYRP